MASEDLLIRMSIVGAGQVAVEVDSAEASLARLDVTAAKASASTGKFSKVLSSFKAAVTAGAVFEAVKGFAKFQQTMTTLQTQTGATHAEVQRATKGILGMAVAVATGPQSLAEAMYHIESAGIRGKDALSALRIAAEGAKVGNADLTDTTTGLTAVVVAGFHGVKTLSEAMGALNATVGSGDMKFQDLNDALSTGILATFKTAGLEVIDFGAALATLGDNNIRGAKAATELRSAVLGMIGPSKNAAKILSSLNIGPMQLANDLRKPNGLLVALTDLRTHLKNLAPAQREAAVVGIFGRRESGPVLTLMNQIDRLKGKYTEIAKAQGGFSKAWEETTHNLSFFIDQAKALGEVVLIRLGGGINTVLHGLLSFIAAFKQGKTWAVALMAALAAGATILGAYAVAVGVVYAKTKLWAAIQAIVNAELWANPIGVVVLALVGLAAAFYVVYTKVAGFRTIVRDVWGWMKGAVVDVVHFVGKHWQLLGSILGGPFVALGIFVATHFQTVKTTVVGVLNWIIDRVNNLISGINGISSSIPLIGGNVVNPLGHINVGGGAGQSTASRGLPGAHSPSPLGHRQYGGPVDYSGVYEVGERGRERVFLPAGSQVQPAGGEQVLEATIPIMIDGRQVALAMKRVGLRDLARS